MTIINRYYRKSHIQWLYCLLVSAALLAVCSRSSPLYPFNYWCDPNCFFTVGKSMMHGLVTYRDIYEQKGVLLYFLHGLAYLVSKDSFLGVYLLEVLSFTVFLAGVLRILKLFVCKVPCLIPAALGALIATSSGFGLGDTAEEFCLPLISWSLYFLLRYIKNYETSKPKLCGALINGIFAGCVFWIKFNLMGFYLGLIITFCLIVLMREGFVPALVTAAVFLLGMFAASLPWLIYFGINHALGDLWTAYFYNNIFLYTLPAGNLLSGILSSANLLLSAMRDSPGVSLLVAAGLLFTLVCPRKTLSVPAKSGIFLTFFLLALGVYCGGRAYVYYVLILHVYCVLGTIPVIMAVEKLSRSINFSPGRRLRLALTALGLVLSLLFSYRYANDTGQLGEDRTAVVQYRFSNLMHQLDETPTLLNYGFLDGGFYTAADIVPTCKYFCALNIPLQTISVVQDDCLNAGLVEFVVTKDIELDINRFNQYELVSKDTFYSFSYYLYHLRS